MADKPQVTVVNRVPQKLDSFQRALHQSIGALLLAKAKQFARTLMAFSPPFDKGEKGTGGTDQAQASGMRAVEHQIRDAFRPIGTEKFADLIMARNTQALWNYDEIVWREANCEEAWKEKNIDKLYTIFQSAGWTTNENDTPYYDDISEELLNRLLKEAGKMPKGYVRDKTIVQRFILMKQKTVGLVSNGWRSALAQLGEGSAPKSSAAPATVVKQEGIKTAPKQKVVIQNGAMQSAAFRASFESSLTPEQKLKLAQVRAAFKDGTFADLNKTIRKVCAKEVKVGSGGFIKVDPDWVKKWCINP
jgi:hypothetical protein